jgi:Zn-dependent protease/CBS domain-containing protein
MRWSWKLGTVRGIGVYVHLTFFLLIPYIIWSQLSVKGDFKSMLFQGALILSVFTCILLHEFGHAFMGLKYGVKTKDITLLPIGGVARMEKLPSEPIHELWIALAGPAVNVVIAILLGAWLAVTNTWQSFNEINLDKPPFFQMLLFTNIFLVVFNMLPAFPMDGGRVLRALLAIRMDYARATSVAVVLGQAMAFIFGFIAVFQWNNPFLILIAVFVWIGASQESQMVQIKSIFAGIPVNRAMITEFHTLSPWDTLDHVIQVMLTGSQHDFPVVQDGKVVGVLTRGKLLMSLAKQSRETLVQDVMEKEFQPVVPTDMLEPILMRFQTSETALLPVISNSQLVGMLTRENIAEFIMIQTAMNSRKHHGFVRHES